MRSINVLFIAIVALALWPQETPGSVEWKYIGPGVGGSMFGIALHPTDPDIIIFGGDMGALYRTENGGESWEIIGGSSNNQPGIGGTWQVKFNSADPNIVWCAGGGVFRSSDAGKTWTNTSAPNGTYCALGLDPDNSDVVYVSEGQAPRSVLSWTTGKVLKTVDGGATWREVSRPGGAYDEDAIKSRNYTGCIVDTSSEIIPGEGHARVFLFGRGGLYRSEDAGASWTDLSDSFATGQIADMIRTERDGQSVLVMTVTPAVGLEKGGVYRSDDNGATWTPMNNGLDTVIERLRERNKTLAEDPTSALFVLLLAHSEAAPDRLYVGSWQGIYRSDDFGQSWQMIAQHESMGYAQGEFGQYSAVPLENSPFQRTLHGGIANFNRMVVRQDDADVVAFSDNQDMYITRDGGGTWNSLSFDYGEQFDTNSFTSSVPNRYTHSVISRGVQNLVCDQVSIDPFDPETYYAAYMDVGLQISRDGGKSWQHPTRGIYCRGHVWTAVPDPGKQGRVFVTVGQKGGQPGGIYRSDDQGRSWTRIGLEDASMGKLGAIAIDLNSPVAERTIYIGSSKNGIYRSVDGGDSWEHITPDFAEAANNITCITLPPDSPGTIYAGTGAGLFVSKSSGETWQRLGEGVFEKVEGLSICRSKPATLYVCAHLPEKNGYWGEAGIWRSDDGGESFTSVTPDFMKYAGAVAVNPYDPDYVYACNYLMESTDEDQKMLIVRSRDGGETWEDIGNGVAFCRGRHISIDPANPQKIFVLTRFSPIEGYDEEAPVEKSEDASRQTRETKTIRLLTVGNSFAGNAKKFLPSIVNSVPGCELELAGADIGGGPLDQHYKLALESETDPEVRPYWYRIGDAKQANLRDILSDRDWDIVTMQQYSWYSFKRDTFTPYFDNIYSYIKKYAPQAEIYIHQTWAYRADDSLFRSETMSQDEMYRLLTENYMLFAEEYGCPILPVGKAFQLCRQQQSPKFVFPDPDYDYENPEEGTLPEQAGSLCSGWRWNKEGKLIMDGHHANDRGCYLAGCVWFEKLFGIDAREVSFVPESLDEQDAEFLRRIAHEAVSSQ